MVFRYQLRCKKVLTCMSMRLYCIHQRDVSETERVAMRVSDFSRRLSLLETEVRNLRAELKELREKERRFVNIKEASRLYGVSESTLRFRCQAGYLAGIAVKVEGRWLINVGLYEERISEAAPGMAAQGNRPT